jgi:hypothetical protein
MIDYLLFDLFGLRLSARPSAVVGFFLLWAALSIGAASLLSLPTVQAIWFGLLATLVHWLSEMWHQLGHAWAARRTGHPMIGVQLWGVLSRSMYPPDEPALPNRVHVQRALGGPLASALLTAIIGAIAYAVWPAQDIAGWLAAFAFIENLFVFTLQAVLPLGFNDGATLWRAWGTRQEG